MGLIVGAHGIAQEYESEVALARAWHDALLGGVRLAVRESGRQLPRTASEPTFSLAFYGNVFRKPGKGNQPGVLVDPIDMTDDEQWLLLRLWEEAARSDPAVPAPSDASKTTGPGRTVLVQRALLALSKSRYFGPRVAAYLPGRLRQVRQYFTDLDVRLAAREAVEREITTETRIIIGHSLGSIVAYEALCANPKWPVTTLVTLGSPLGVSHIVFERLWPEPGTANLARWPGAVGTWVNVADRRDPVALVKKLDGLFAGGRIHDIPIDNGPTEHDVRPYLSAIETGRTILRALVAEEG
jgi:hypothetical protein